MRRSLIVLLILVLFPWSSWAAVTCDTLSSNAVEADPQTVSYTVGTTSTVNRIVVAMPSWRSDVTVTGVTFDGVAMTRQGTGVLNTTPTPDIGGEIYVMTGVSSGTFNATVDWSGTPAAQSTLLVMTCYGVDQTTPVRSGSVTTNTANSATSVSIDVSSAVGDLVIDLVGVAAVDAGEPTIGGSQTIIGACVPNGTANFDSCVSSEPGGASVTMSWSAATSENWATIGMSLVPAVDAVFGPLRRW